MQPFVSPFDYRWLRVMMLLLLGTVCDTLGAIPSYKILDNTHCVHSVVCFKRALLPSIAPSVVAAMVGMHLHQLVNKFPAPAGVNDWSLGSLFMQATAATVSEGFVCI